LPSGRKRPIRDEVKFRLGRAVAIGGDVMTNIFDAVGEKLAFLQLKSHAIFHEDIANTFKQAEKSSENSSP
jgi:hypothetical protein